MEYKAPLFFHLKNNVCLLWCCLSLPAVRAPEAESQAAEVLEVIYDDVPSEDPLSPDDGQYQAH